MVILGIDPGTATTGWGVIHVEGKLITCLGVGIIATAAGLALEERLVTIFDDLQTLLGQYQPEAVAVEQLFFNTNAKTAMLVGQARGVVLVAAKKHGAEVFSYTPLQVKMALTGYGRADKKQIQTMVTQTLKLKTTPKPDDAADALAVALTQAFSQKMKRLETKIPRKK